MAVYDIRGTDICDGGNNAVAISDIRSAHPEYTDDQLLSAAIAQAEEVGGSAKIVWDGLDIHFDGSITHVCKGFGGIDFNGSKIYMPNYDNGVIIKIEPDTSIDLTVSASAILEDRTTDARLKDKVFKMNDGGKTAGNPDMCLGTRMRDPLDPTDVVYWSPTIITDPDGRYKTGTLYLSPNTGEIICYNVHDLPEITFELCNGRIISYSGTTMSNFVLCTRSNVCVHGFRLEGMSGITSYRDGIFFFNCCCLIEVYGIYGVNPVQKDLSSGYALYCRSVTSLYAHDIFMGDATRWGAIGCHFLHNCVFERCFMNRWDCHFAQTGLNVIRECTLGYIKYSVGCGSLIIENCIIKNDLESNAGRIELRPDTPGVFNGEIVVRNCLIYIGDVSASDVKVWDDGCWKEKPTNSVISDAPLAKRMLDNCIIIGDYDVLFRTGTSYANDKTLFKDLVVEIRGINASAQNALVYAPSTLEVKKIVMDKCELAGDTLMNLSCDLVVTDSAVESIVTNTILPSFIATGNKFSGAQTVSKFTTYAMSGNIAADMASVNRHS